MEVVKDIKVCSNESLNENCEEAGTSSANEVLDLKDPGKWLDVEGRSTERRQQEEFESVWKGGW